ncbi:MAG TPA: glycoside hydrolase family 9 protein [Verrucomicrobiota bacterium]|nr:glycoside hydrolase family 9 protein [Verrucomicrobiota bacterium]
MWNRLSAILAVVFVSVTAVFGGRVSTMDYSVQASAEVQARPAQITLRWVQSPESDVESYMVFRRSPGESSWGEGIILPGSTTSYVDADVQPGTPYEYQIVKQARTHTGYGYLYAGIDLPIPEYRGRLLLVVDNTHAASLAFELARLRQDLAGDGWSVTRIDVSRDDPVTRVKSLIKAEYDADPENVKAVFLFGRVPVPYSGDIVPDGHYREHEGAWPADGYYADMDGEWTDATVTATRANDLRNHNVPGDGKFDQSSFPSPLELMIGRVDLANMPGRLVRGGEGTFPSEVELLRNYLNKNHRFRNGLLAVEERAVVGDYFGVRDGEAFAASGWRNFSAFFGPEKVRALTDEGTWIPTLKTNACLWAYGCGSGSYTSIGGIGGVGEYHDGLTTDIVGNNLKAVFTMLYGSWLGDWDSEDNLQRAVLATSDYGLTCSWSGRPHWFLHHMAMGEPIGFSTLVTQNNGFTRLYRNERNNCANWVHVALMGDPTLRMHVVAPPSAVQVRRAGDDAVLTWTASADDVLGYNVYRAASLDERFTRLNAEPVIETQFTDAGAPGNSVYMVRAVKRQASASGTYVNLSQGGFAQPEGLAHGIAGSVTAPPASAATKPADASAEKEAEPVSPEGERLSATGLPGDIIWMDDSVPAGAVTDSLGGDAWNWVTSNPAPLSGARAVQSSAAPELHQLYFHSAGTPLPINPGDTLFAYVYLDPANPPSEIMLQWNDGTWEHRAYWGANQIWWGTENTESKRRMGDLPAAGQWVRLEVPAAQVGLEGRSVTGVAFTLFGGRATWDCVGKKSSSSSSDGGSGSGDFSWVDDALPAGAVAETTGGDVWEWVTSNPAPQSGTRAHRSAARPGLHQHYFSVGTPMMVNAGDWLYAYVYLDPQNLPSQVMLQWYDGATWDHRAYWGVNQLWWGREGTAECRRMGPLPPAGQWVRLLVPAHAVGLEGKAVSGMAFTLFDGRAAWDNAGKTSASFSFPGPGSGTNDSVVGTNPPPVVGTNPPPTTNPPPAASDSGTNGLLPGTLLVDNIAFRMPGPGDHALRLVHPTLLELKLINTKDPAAARVTQWDWVDNHQFSAPPLNAFEATVNGQRVPVQAVGFKRRPMYAPLARYDLRIDNTLYLQLGAPVADHQTVEVKNPDGTLWDSSLQFKTVVDPLRYSPAIHVNQEGYMPNFSKKAMVGYYLGSLGEMPVNASSGFRIVDAKSGATVYQGSLVRRPDVGYSYTPTPYQEVFEADFTDFNTPGEYQLVVPGLGASLPFRIDAGIAMNFARTYALGLYHQRCGTDNAMPFTRYTHEKCHHAPAAIPSSAGQFPFTWNRIAEYAQSTNPDNPAQIAPRLTSPEAQLFPFVREGTIDVSGGHHDAGDYSKYTLNSVALIHYLIWAVDSMPGVAELDNLGLPESGDGISDILQEAKWEADFLAKMQDRDGGFYFLVYPVNREYEIDALPENGDPQVVWPKTSSATASAVAALAQCASSPAFRRAYPAEAAMYLQKAQLGWQFLMNAIARYGKGGIYQKITHYGDNFADQDELAWAACEMYLATGDPQYHETLMQWFPDPTDPATFRWGWWRLFLSYGNAVRSYAFAARSGRLQPGQLNAEYLAKCEATILACGDDLVKWSRQNAYGTSFPEATKRVRGAGWYFSGDQAFDLAVAYQIDPKPDYMTAILANMNYEGGCNPVNVSYVTGLGWKRQLDAVSQYSANDRRLVPSTGMPIGNIQSGFSHLEHYKGSLGALCFPWDDAPTAPYPFYDRWGDSWNVSTEFVAFQQARSLATYAFLAAQTPLKSQPWRSATARIAGIEGTVSGETTVSLQADGLDLSQARVVWETRDGGPALTGPAYTFTPTINGEQWIEAEAVLPDGRRVFAVSDFTADTPNVVWVDDALPAGAKPASDGGDSWNWISSNPSPQSGTKAHASALAPGVHQHFFRDATATMKVDTGAVLYAYVYLDPASPPSEVMLQWRTGDSWEHRAYWGANEIPYGVNGTASRHRVGGLPPAGQWVQLQVPASEVGLEGRTVNGMAFALFGGRAFWDAAGVMKEGGTNSTPGGKPLVTVTAADGSRAGLIPGRFTFTRIGDASSPLTLTFTLGGTAENGVDYYLPIASPAAGNAAGLPSITIPAGETSATLTVEPVTAPTLVDSKTVVLTLESNATYSVVEPGRATAVLAGNSVRPSALTMSPSGPRLSWPSAAGASYRIWYKDDLSDPAWTDYGVVSASGTNTVWTDSENRAQRFYLILRIE